MASSYPPPPSPTAASETPVPGQGNPAASPHLPQLHPYVDASNAGHVLQSPETDAMAAAHHGLQVLQAATAETTSLDDSSGVVAQTVQALQNVQAVQYASPPQNPFTNGNAGALLSPVAPPQQQQLQQQEQRNSQSKDSKEKLTRLRRACDLCSQRKVKCTETQPCQPCIDLKVECTFHREMKRRGPPNRHVEAARASKFPRLEPSASASPNTQQNAAQALVSIAAQAGLDAESIAPWQCLVLLIDDFFTYIHPLIPFPHEPTFRRAFFAREDKTNPEFLALVAGMIGVLAASFPRAVRLTLKAQHGMNLFPKALAMIEKCRSVALEARGAKFDEKDPMTVHDAATSYFLGLAAGYTLQLNYCRRFFSQCGTILRELNYHTKRKDVYAVTYRGPPFDYISDEIGKRIFWVLFLGYRSMTQIGGGAQWDMQFPIPTRDEPFPDLPLELDDEMIAADHLVAQPEGSLSYVRGFIEAIRVYLTMEEVVKFDLSQHTRAIPIDYELQKTLLVDSLRTVKATTDALPPVLKLNLSSNSSSTNTSAPTDEIDYFEKNGYEYFPPAHSGEQPPSDIRHIIDRVPERKRALQFEIQKANIYISALATRSYFVERYHSLRDSHLARIRSDFAQTAYPAVNGDGGDDIDTASKAVAAQAMQAIAAAEQKDDYDHEMAAERDLIVQDLVTVLASINQRDMEPNGNSLINKIRTVAATLLDTSTGSQRTDRLRLPSEDYLDHFVRILTSLEKTTGSRPDHNAMTAHDEEEELRNWAELKQYQQQLLQSGGLVQSM